MRQMLLNKGINISKEGVNKRINGSLVLLLKEILGDLLNIKLEKLNTRFSSIIITDATSFELPECLVDKYKGFGGNHGVRAGVKIQHQLSITDGKTAVEVSSATRSDFKSALIRPKSGELHLFDLGYFEFPRFIEFDKKQAYYLCRLKLNTVVWIKKNEQWEILDWVALNRKITPFETLELDVYLGKEKEIKTRLFVKKVSGKVAARKRKELKRYCQRHKNTPTQKRLAICDLSIHITNAPEDLIDKTDVQKIYSLRWQIELQFKTWKSFMKIDAVRATKTHRFESHLYGCLIFCLLCAKLMFFNKIRFWKNSNKELSELKVMKFLSTFNDLFSMLFASENNARDHLWKSIYGTIQKTCGKEVRMRKKKPMEIVLLALS